MICNILRKQLVIYIENVSLIDFKLQLRYEIHFSHTMVNNSDYCTFIKLPNEKVLVMLRDVRLGTD